MEHLDLYSRLGAAIALYAPHAALSFTLHLEDGGSVALADGAPGMNIACMSLTDSGGGDSMTSVWYAFPEFCMVLADSSPHDMLAELASSLVHYRPIIADTPEELARIALTGE